MHTASPHCGGETPLNKKIMKRNIILSIALAAAAGLVPCTIITTAGLAPAAAAEATQAMPLGSIKTMDEAIAALPKPEVKKGLEKIKNGEQGINTCVYGVYTPIAYAASMGNRDAVAFFLSQGADVNGVDPENKFSVGTLTMAVSANKPELVKELVQARADVNLLAGTDTPFIRAASAQNMEMMKLLIELGADPKAVDNEGRTALMMGLRRNGISVGKIDFNIMTDYLIDTCGIDPNASDKKGMTALMHACVFLTVEQMEHLIAKGADPTAKTQKQEGLVFFIVKSGTPAKALEQLKALEKYKLDFNNGTNEKDIMPLYNVISSNMKCKEALPLLQYMVEHGSRTDLVWGTCGYPTLYAAAGNNIADGPELLQYLLDKKVGDVNEVNKYGTTALMNVKKPCMIAPLLKAGADPTIKNKQGKTAYQLAEKNPKLKEAFEAAGVKE